MASTERREGSQDLSLDIPEVLLKEQVIVFTRDGRKLSIGSQQEDGVTAISIMLLGKTIDSWSLSRGLIIEIGNDGSQTYSFLTEAWKRRVLRSGVASDLYQYWSDKEGGASVTASSGIPLYRDNPSGKERLRGEDLRALGFRPAFELPVRLDMKRTAEGFLGFAAKVLENSDSLAELAIPELVPAGVQEAVKEA